VTKIQTTVADAEVNLTNAYNDNVAQFNQLIDATKETIQSIKEILDLVNTVV
jgi:hypothetical protein